MLLLSVRRTVCGEGQGRGSFPPGSDERTDAWALGAVMCLRLVASSGSWKCTRMATARVIKRCLCSSVRSIGSRYERFRVCRHLLMPLGMRSCVMAVEGK